MLEANTANQDPRLSTQEKSMRVRHCDMLQFCLASGAFGLGLGNGLRSLTARLTTKHLMKASKGLLAL
eukprot:2007352-Amphidinium_carterae.1